jgi:hypothetical protein
MTKRRELAVTAEIARVEAVALGIAEPGEYGQAVLVDLEF